MIYAGPVRKECWDLFVFKDIGKLSVFNGDRSRSSDCGYGFERNVVVVGGKVRVEVNHGGEGFLVASDIGNREKKEFVTLRIDSSGRKDSEEKTFRLWIRRIRRIG